MDITQIHKLIEDYKAASGEYPGSILVPPDVQHRLNQYAADCNEKSPVTTLMGIPVVVDFFAPLGTVYVGKAIDKEQEEGVVEKLKELFEDAMTEYTNRALKTLDQLAYGNLEVSEEQQQKNIQDFFNPEPYGKL